MIRKDKKKDYSTPNVEVFEIAPKGIIAASEQLESIEGGDKADQDW